MNNSIAGMDGTYHTAQVLVQDYFDARSVESDPVLANIQLLLGEAYRALPDEHRLRLWPDLLAPLSKFLLECQRLNPRALQEATARNAFVQDSRFQTLTRNLFPAGQAAAAGVGPAQDDASSIVPVSGNDGAESAFRPRGLLRSFTGSLSLFKPHKGQK